VSDFNEIKQDVKDIKKDVTSIKEDIARNTVSLETHMKRTELNEDRIQKMEYFMLGGLMAIIVACLKLLVNV
jgi:predicted methyltransferase